ncbi:uncharacterized protein ACNLHF_001742 [Anomaloglossus baeobatrachus]
MKNLVAILYIVSALVVLVLSLNCYSGFSSKSTKYNESEIECMGDRCMAASQYIFINGSVFNSFLKGCANETMCGAKGSASVGSLRYRFNVNCCTGYLCNSGEYELPAEDPTPNGKKCPSAFCTGTLEECKSDKVMNCTGSMDQCYEYRADATVPGGREMKFSVKGCLNDDACKFNFDCAIGVSILQRKYLKC